MSVRRTTPSPRTTTSRRARRALLALTLGGALALGAPAPASAGGDCVFAYPQPNYGATICTPWGG